MVKPQDVTSYRLANLLPKQLLHPVIAQKVWADFLRGDYASAVGKAFKAVEVGVRAAGGFGPQDYGTDLMRKAFHARNGPLTDPGELPGEKQGASDLFAGAIACYRNPTSHRDVEFEADEAAELIMFASRLLKTVDARTPPSAPT
jgi:uncharacterized protein (TIGR02391 family)